LNPAQNYVVLASGERGKRQKKPWEQQGDSGQASGKQEIQQKNQRTVNSCWGEKFRMAFFCNRLHAFNTVFATEVEPPKYK